MGARYRGLPSGDHLWLDQDGSAGTPILPYERGRPYPEHLSYDVVSAAYPIASPHRACIIGGGGGRDILKALQGGATDVEVVELNPYIVDAVSRVFSAHSGDPYHLPGVHAFVGEGRNHFSRSHTPCDVIEISQIDTFAASAAGAYALTENSLYTIEAIRMFWSHLSERGVLSVSRWVSGPAWPESVRLVLLEVEALRQEGIAEPRNHMVVLAAGDTANVLLFRQARDAAAIRSRPGRRRRPGLRDPMAGCARQHRRVGAHARARARPGRHDTARLRRLPAHRRSTVFLPDAQHSERLVACRRGGNRTRAERHAAPAARGHSRRAGVRACPAAARRPRNAAARPHFGRNTLFFSCLGFGFMFVEIPLLQTARGVPRTSELLDDRGPGVAPRRCRIRGVARRAHRGIAATTRRLPRSARGRRHRLSAPVAR